MKRVLLMDFLNLCLATLLDQPFISTCPEDKLLFILDKWPDLNVKPCLL